MGKGEGNCNVEKEMCQAIKAIWHYWDSRVRWGGGGSGRG